MKVSIVVGGRWHAFDLARELNDAGVLHRLITNYPKFKTRQWNIPDEKVVSLPLSLGVSRAVYKLGQEKLFMKYQALVHDLFSHAVVKHLSGSDIIHGWSSFSLPALHWAKQNKVPFLLERSSSHMEVQCQLLREEYQRLGLTWSETHPKIIQQELQEYSLADRIAVPSLFVKRSFLSQGFPEERLVHSPFGTNLDCFSPGIKIDHKFRVVYAGSLSVRKGIHYLVQGFKNANIPDSELVLVGGNTTDTPQLIGPTDERIHCVGHVPQKQLVEYYRNSSVFVMASIEEGLACVQAQAMACGLPLICTTNTGGEDLLRMSGASKKLDNGIEEYPAGYLVPSQDSYGISQCLRFLANDTNLLQEKINSALTLRDTDLSWTSYGKRTIKVYEKTSYNC